MVALGQEYVIFYGIKPMEVRGVGAGASNILEFWTMEGYAVGFLIDVAIVAFRSIREGDKGAGLVLSVIYFEVDSDGNLNGVGPEEGDTLGVS